MSVMEAYQILLLILVFVSFLYLTVIVYVLGQIRQFKNRLKREIKGLNLLLYERGDTVTAIVSLFQKEGVVISEEEMTSFDAVALLKYDVATEESYRLHASKVKDATTRVRYLAQANPWATKHEDYPGYIALLDDLERNHRTLVGQYNLDLLAFNYWVNIPTLRWLARLIGMKPRSNIN